MLDVIKKLLKNLGICERKNEVKVFKEALYRVLRKKYLKINEPIVVDLGIYFVK